MQTADGLAKAHGAGIVHRDLKPENLMISKDGFVKILDFGLAKLVEPSAVDASAVPTAAASPTEPGTVMGTAGYMSPEQARGQEIDFRSDQFSLGTILYEMATGKRAFRRDTAAETLVAIIRDEPPPLSQAAPQAPAPVRWIVERCLAKDPEERYASTQGSRARSQERARPSLGDFRLRPGPRRPGRTAPRRRWLAPAALAFVVGAGLALLAARSLGLFAPAQPVFQRLTFRSGAILTARFAPDGKSVIYGAAWDGNPVEIFTTRPESPDSKSLGLPSADLLAVSRTGDLAISLGWHPLTGFESSGRLARVPASGGAPRDMLESVEGADWSPDGRELAVLRREGDRVRLEYPIGTVLHESTGWLNNLRISPDGRSAAFIQHPERGDNAGWLMFFDLGKRSLVQGPRVPGTSAFAWSPRGDVVIGGGGMSAGIQRRVSTSGKERPWVSLAGGFTPEDIAPDGRLLAKRINYRREIVGAAAGESRERKLSWLNWSYPDDISNDGTTLLFDEQTLGRDNYLCYVRKMDGSPAVLLGQVRGLALSPDGRWALTANADSSQLSLLPTGAGSPKPLPKAGLLHQWGTFFPDGKRLLFWANEPGKGSRLYVQEIEGAGPRRSRRRASSFRVAGNRSARTAGRSSRSRRTGRASSCRSTRRVAAPPRHARGRLPLRVDRRRPLALRPAGRHARARRRSRRRHRGAPPLERDHAPGSGRHPRHRARPDPPDGKSYVYSYRRMLDDLFLVTGLNAGGRNLLQAESLPGRPSSPTASTCASSTARLPYAWAKGSRGFSPDDAGYSPCARTTAASSRSCRPGRASRKSCRRAGFPSSRPGGSPMGAGSSYRAPSRDMAPGSSCRSCRKENRARSLPRGSTSSSTPSHRTGSRPWGPARTAGRPSIRPSPASRGPCPGWKPSDVPLRWNGRWELDPRL